VKHIEPNANFIMIDTGCNAREFISAMPKMGVPPGRPFPPLDNMLLVTIGTDAEMAKFRDVSGRSTRPGFTAPRLPAPYRVGPPRAGVRPRN
jgi:hypothetical protein